MSCERALGINNLARALQAQGDDEQAELLHREALTMRRKLLSQEHPDMAQSLINLGRVLLDQDRYKEAEPLLLESLAIYQKAELDNEIATTQQVLIDLYTAWGKPDKAAAYQNTSTSEKQPAQ